jgi:hypothetical protein
LAYHTCHVHTRSTYYLLNLVVVDLDLDPVLNLLDLHGTKFSTCDTRTGTALE